MLPSVSPAAAADLTAIAELLAANGLPTADVREDSRPEFMVARQDRQLIGVVGLERFGDVGLLRSLAVSAEHRRSGLGIRLTRAAEERAAQAGLKSLVLLTETAAGFFERRGYQVIARAEAPAAVQTSTEFRTLCPASAVCMIRSLELERG
jgi:amino-acid N-acetyltransferase